MKYIYILLFFIFLPLLKASSEKTHPMALSWKAEVNLINFNLEQKNKITRAIEIIKKVIRSEEFKRRIIQYASNGRKGFVDNQGLSNEMIYLLILEGREKVGNTKKNNTMNVELELYYRPTKTIGHTYPDVPRIWMNKKYFLKYNAINVANNLMHEWLHKLGFTHSGQWTEEREHTVPYAVGYIIEDIAKKLKFY